MGVVLLQLHQHAKAFPNLLQARALDSSGPDVEALFKTYNVTSERQLAVFRSAGEGCAGRTYVEPDNLPNSAVGEHRWDCVQFSSCFGTAGKPAPWLKP